MSEIKPEPHLIRYEDMTVGMKESYDYVITPEVYGHFLKAFQDHSSIHVDDAYAQSRGFKGRVMHGTLLNGFFSHFVGMHFPGKMSLLLSVDIRFSNPSYLNDRLRLDAELVQKLDARRVVVMDFQFTNRTRDWMAAKGRAQVMLAEDGV